MPSRILKESICTSDNLDMLSAFAETVFYRLIVNCDDFGRMDARPKILASKLFPLKDIRSNQMEDALRALTSAELVDLYTVGGKPFLQMKTWDRHQQIRAKKSKYPAMSESDINCNQMQADDFKCSRNPIQSESESESNPNAVKRARAHFTPPTVEDVSAYCRERGNSVDPQRFVDFYAAKGWKVGNQPMKDWQAAVRTWEQRDGKPTVKTVSAQAYGQRNYTEDELLSLSDDLMAEAKAMRGAL